MLNQLVVKNLTVFSNAQLTLGQHLNVIVGENGTGKTHLLKIIYATLATSAQEGRKPNASAPTKSLLQYKLADKLINVFRAESLGRLARRTHGRERCEIHMIYSEPALNLLFSFAPNSKSEVTIEKLPQQWIQTEPTFLPTRELLTLFPNFISVYENHYLEFEENWRDVCVQLGALLQKGEKEKRIRQLLMPLEKAMGGTIELDKNGRFYLKTHQGRMEMPLVAEGLRKLGMLARLIATGALLDKGYLFWDEPEANLNPKLIRAAAQTLIALAENGIQVFIATHSFFLLKELDILMRQKPLQKRFIGLSQQGNDADITIEQGDCLHSLKNITALDEELAQYDREMDARCD